jgi:hypothetical protein
MDKQLLIRMPFPLYTQTLKLCKKRYMSISSFIRGLLIEQVEGALSPREARIVVQGEKQYLKGKGTDWRKVKRG